MRPARPVICEPALVIAPVYSDPASVNSGSCGLPLVNDVAVVVTEAELIVVAPLLSTCSVELEAGGGRLENCRWLEPSAAFNCEPTGVPVEKLIPIIFGLALVAF